MEKIFGEILSMSIDSAWLIIAVIIARFALQKAPMYFRKILWGLVGLRLVIPFSFQSALSLVPNNAPQTAEIVAGQVVADNVAQEITFADVVPVLWTVVGIGFLIYGIISYIKLKIKISDSVLVENNIYHSDKIESPFVCGFIKPKIYLPYGLNEVT
jgi:beta-lactamase regulating signal transducer with metallopeptidase domain